jgi:hypothetical protein
MIEVNAFYKRLKVPQYGFWLARSFSILGLRYGVFKMLSLYVFIV